ncbi:Protein of unknown function [Halogranum amylolyticum]|uniref:DUF1059 domain-containing protein n=1 Tax=Halogranum amylolyticum TaxID=660520 RepID=A0A1H8QL78_9EURY|nr:DUF1059 domain-containing protein [Halogranum amylolyticum]SEO54697.1 Protein of unknown function [Halogranum amylolyticum]
MAKQFECTMEDCDFMIRANEEGEVIHIVREHAQDKHGMSISDKDVREGMATA